MREIMKKKEKLSQAESKRKYDRIEKRGEAFWGKRKKGNRDNKEREEKERERMKRKKVTMRKRKRGRGP